jgi:hypothetical protein
MKPWKLDVTLPEEKQKLDEVLSTVMIGLAYIGYNLAPFFDAGDARSYRCREVMGDRSWILDSGEGRATLYATRSREKNIKFT